MALAAHYFEVICCPRCRADLGSLSESQLHCLGCGAEYPVVEGIPVLFGDTDERSREVKAFYERGWERDENQVLRAVVQHADVSSLGQRYMVGNEARFTDWTSAGGRFFLDAGCGATPRVELGREFAHHVCLDLSLTGLVECSRRLGPRAVCVCGSLVQAPIREGACDAVLASHSLYHIDRDLQPRALAELWRTLGRGPLIVFYSNPGSLEGRLVAVLRWLLRRRERESDLYFHPLPLTRIRRALAEVCANGSDRVETLRLVSKRITQPLFAVRGVGSLVFRFLKLVEWVARRRPQWATYVCLTAVKR